MYARTPIADQTPGELQEDSPDGYMTITR